MNTEKAKSFVILCLSVLFVVLLIISNTTKMEYTLTKAQESSVKLLLEDNKIILNTAIIKNYEPKKMVSMKQHTFDLAELEKIFFEPSEKVNLVETFSETTLSHDTREVRLDKNVLSIDDDFGFADNEFLSSGFNSDSSRALADRYVDLLTGKDKSVKFYMDKTYEEFDENEDEESFLVENNDTMLEKSFVYEYRGTFRDNIIYTNYIKIKISENGITRIRSAYNIPFNFFGEAISISSPDEVLLAFYYELKNIYGDSPIQIDSMDFVYYLENNSWSEQAEDSERRAIPYYRFYISDEEGEIGNTPFLINAYTNNLLK